MIILIIGAISFATSILYGNMSGTCVVYVLSWYFAFTQFVISILTNSNRARSPKSYRWFMIHDLKAWSILIIAIFDQNVSVYCIFVLLLVLFFVVVAVVLFSYMWHARCVQKTSVRCNEFEARILFDRRSVSVSTSISTLHPIVNFICDV